MIDRNFGSIFKELDDIFGGLLGRWPQPPKHLPLRILELSGDPWPDEIRKAYRAKLLDAHPDLRPAFDNPEYQEMAQKGRGDLSDIQELVWARDCALRQAPGKRPVTDSVSNIDNKPIRVTPSKPDREYFDNEPGKPRICRLCGKQIEPIRIATSKWPVLFCDDCVKTKHENWWYQRCRGCGVWMNRDREKYCCSECQREAEARRKREHRQQWRMNKTCPICGEKFTPKRADAKYCSAACRQRAFRKRQVIDEVPAEVSA